VRTPLRILSQPWNAARMNDPAAFAVRHYQNIISANVAAPERVPILLFDSASASESKEDPTMISKRTKAIAAVTAAAIALTTVGSAPALAGAKPQAKAASEISATQFSSRNRNYGYYRGNNNAAAAAMVGAIITGVAAYAAAREYRKSRERSYYGNGYGEGYGPYAPQPYYQEY
jgi:hypothetical protein